MLLVADVRDEHRIAMTEEEQKLFGIEKLNVPRSSIPAVTHVDYSARVQTVHKETNPRFHELLSQFKQKTGCPVIVNTSFNVRISSQGLRDREHRIAKPAGTYRIAVLGDSYAEAMQVEMDHAFWALLPEKLKACGFAGGKSIETVNFGVSGYGTAHELLMLQN